MLLIGVVVNDGIVLIDYANRLRAEDRGRKEVPIPHPSGWLF